ncbi:MAG TPA: RdgB/HAM1 family non-canonical purine NTP pyrophosphatase [Bacteroidota bacterium]|nr:RdgB/HAM1 family non-canonical purine NTP pyrophosphatase [Bacteroidota bacterium]
MELLIATHNRHKVDEISHILNSPQFSLKSADDFPRLQQTIEDQPTLEGNAMKKAAEAFNATGVLSIADDTGLECYYLELRPGVFSARYAGDHATYADNNEKLLRELKGVPPRRRNARFRTVIAIVGKDVRKIVEGKVEGYILEAPRGMNGFGYDPLFVPLGSRISYAQMSMEEKNKVSHRAMAVAKAVDVLREMK